VIFDKSEEISADAAAIYMNIGFDKSKSFFRCLIRVTCKTAAIHVDNMAVSHSGVRQYRIACEEGVATSATVY
jgi:hypothetical protein